MPDRPVTDRDRALARVCAGCPVCRRARTRQQGLAYRFVRGVEGRVCPFCRAYERVHGRKAHEPVPEYNVVTWARRTVRRLLEEASGLEK